METNTTFDLADDVLANTYAAIDRNGYELVSVLGSGAHPSWQYTIGLPHFGYPELLIIGIAPEHGAAVIDHIWDLMLDGEPPSLGFDEPHDLGGIPFRVLPVPNEVWNETGLFGMAANYWSSLDEMPAMTYETLAWQVVWPDDDGWFPWHDEFDLSLRRLQPLLCLGDELGEPDPDANGHDHGHPDCYLCQIYGPPDSES
jgi:hypothetical protein